MKNVGILARLLGRAERPAPVVSALYANAIGQPLLVHPQMGEQLIGGYLRGAVDVRPPTIAISDLAPESVDPTTGVVTSARRVAVINVSGGLANRLSPGECDPGPVSYEGMRAAFDQAMADPTVEHIVHRLESPGGMASGCFDYTDHVAANRGKKPIWAAIDDYAYSGGYAIAAACDPGRVWITRTGGAGSVGAIGYHQDQSAFDAKVGVKITPVFSGAHKNDLSPHAPLADEQRNWLQMRMDRLRDLFVDRVATYRGMDAAAVLATEAQVYQGAEAVAIGFADRLGTFAELMRELAEDKDDEDMPEEPNKMSVTIDLSAAKNEITQEAWRNVVAQMIAEQQQSLATLRGVKEFAQAADSAPTTESMPSVCDRILAANLRPDLAVALMQPKAGVTVADVDARIAHASAIANICFAAGLPDVAADYVTANTPVETARAQLIDLKASSKHELDTNHPTESKPTVSRLDVAGIYERRNQRHTP